MSSIVFSPQCAALQEVEHEGPDKGELKAENGVKMMCNNFKYHRCECEQKTEGAVITLNKVKQHRQHEKKTVKRWTEVC